MNLMIYANKNCLNCNKQFQDHSKNKCKKFCSKYCCNYLFSQKKRKYKDTEYKNCLNCNKKFQDNSKCKSKKYCTRKCYLDDFKKSGKKSASMRKYRLTEHCKLQQKRYSQSEKGRIKASIRRKKYWFQNKNNSIHQKQRKCWQVKWRNSALGKETKRKNFFIYYYEQGGKEKSRLWRKRYYSTQKGKAIMNAKTNKRRAYKLKAIPKWANLEGIKEIYKKCKKGYHVDHIIPLRGPNVCGLHVENNLQILKARDNIVKSNRV